VDAIRPCRDQHDKQLFGGNPLIKRRVVAFGSILVGLLLLGLWIGHERLLQRAARLWVRSDPVQPADAVAIFGGGIETRPLAAAEYFRRGLVPRILVSDVDSGAEPPSSRSHTQQNLAELKKLGVPDAAIQIFGCHSSNTYEEARALRRWSLDAGAHSLIVPTEHFSARRVRWITQEVFLGTGVQVRVPVIGSLDYLKPEWWDNSDALLAFQREVIKYMGYRLIYMLIPTYERGGGSVPCENR
jgi:uncharacterized SAM-binding protein YcdF (DUF218 family)